MADLKDMLRRLADLYEAEEKAELTRAQEERIAKLEKQLAGASQEDREDALEEITDDEYDLIRQHRASLAAGAGRDDDDDDEEDDKPTVKKEEKPRRVRPGRRNGNAYQWTVDDKGRVRKLDIPSIYNGDDEPEEVELPDDEAAA
jgi:hypothetical protein